MARLITLACIVLLAASGCGRKQSDLEQLHTAARATLAAKTLRVVARTTTLGGNAPPTTLEHIGTDARVLSGTTVLGVFIGKYVYAADNQDPSTFMRCPRGTHRFDTYAAPLRAAAHAKRVRRRGSVLIVDPLVTDKTTRTRGEVTVDGGRVRRMTLIQHPNVPGDVSPPVTIDFRFSYTSVPAITAPPSDTLEEPQAC
jgi:hypothetical protein